MCGILGMAALPGRSLGLSESEIVQMRDSMISRGPDGEGLVHREPMAFAHRRLAIRDRRGGAQPFWSGDEQTVLIYNGELYNEGHLRKQLAATGCEFRTRCDTEVVLAAYRQWGPDCVEHLRGMFAFAVYDFRDNSMFVARDRFGVKPLFFCRLEDGLQVASSIGSLLRHPRIAKKPNLRVISHYLTTFRLTLGRDTVFDGIQQVLPGESLRFQDGQLSCERYWNYPSPAESSIDFAEATAELEDLLDDAVQSRLVSDVPVGLFLSGGVDSSAIACHVRRHHAERMVAKCGGGDTGDSPDFAFAARCAEHAKFDFGEVRVSAERYQRDWVDLIGRYRTPLATPSDVIIYNLALSMKKEVGVVLGGEGADEALCGYAVPHWAGRDFDHKQALEAGQWKYGDRAAAEFVNGLRSQYGRDSFSSLTDHYFALNSLIPTNAKVALFQPWAWREAEQDDQMWSYYAEQLENLGEIPATEKYSRLLHRINLESLLSRLDSATMQASLEARVPYTDHHLVDRMFRIPQKHQIAIDEQESAPHLPSGSLEQRGTIRSKRLLRSLAQRLMPAELALRKKASFPTPVQSWLAGPWSGWAARQLRRSEFAKSILQPQAIEELASNVTQAGMWLWPILNISLWGDREFGCGAR